VLNETVALYKIAKSHCPDCTFDPVRQESTDYNCETCDGTGFINSEQVFTIPASIEQEEDFKYDFSKAGKFIKGEIYLTIDSVEIKTVLDPTSQYNLDDYNQMKAFIEQYDHVLWKGAKYSIKSFEPGWLQGNLYEIGFTLSIVE
jgi:hypothetical protein